MSPRSSFSHSLSLPLASSGRISCRLQKLSLVCLLSVCFYSSLATASSETGIEQLDRVVVTAQSSELEALEKSAKAVSVIDLEQDQKLTADMGEVLSRVPGISIRRSGGLGSRARFSLNGLRDDQIRFFLDGIPLDMTPYTFGISNIPVNLVERVDIYHGVVPISFGADALAGAVNLIAETDSDDQTLSGSASVQFGDFNTLRSTANMKYFDFDSGFFSQLNAFADSSDNNYEVDVKIGNEKGQQEADTVERFHDVYRATGANLDFGVKHKSWADLLQLSLYSGDSYKEIQHSRDMTVVYGKPTVERQVNGINLRYLYQLNPQLKLQLVGGGSKTQTNFVDKNDFRYDWRGKEIIAGVPNPGEIGNACDCIYWRDSQIARVNLDWQIAANHSLGFSLAPTWSHETAKNKLIASENIDWADADRSLFSMVAGSAYTADFFADKLQNIFFVKHYQQKRKSKQVNKRTFTYEKFNTSINRQGWGNQTRYQFNDFWSSKLSYEVATRMPRAQEAFGDSINILANAELKPEVSHNYNLSVALNNWTTDYGFLSAETNYFIRDSKDLISLRPYGNTARYENIGQAESKGIHASMGWTSASRFIDINLNMTQFDFINKSKTGPLSLYKGSRVPNTPYQFFNSAAGLNWLGVLTHYDELNFKWHFRYVQKFSLLWQGLGPSNNALATVPAQKSHTISTTYSREIRDYELTLSAEVQNLMDVKLYDYFGVQRPGRNFNIKAILKF